MRKKFVCTLAIIMVLFLVLPPEAYTAEPDNSPSVAIADPTADLTFGSTDNISISGTVSDADSDDVTVAAAIYGKQAVDTVAGGNGNWTLTWDIDSLNIAPDTYSNIVFTADDGNGGSDTAEYTGSLVVTSTAGGVINFSDTSLKNALINAELGIDTDGNGEISISEAQTVTVLSLEDKGIRDITGLERFTALTELNLDFNAISDIAPLAGLTALTDLSLRANEIVNISPLAGLESLRYLHMANNRISDISPLSNLTSLRYADLPNNQIRDIRPLSDLAANLTQLNLSGNSYYESSCNNAVHLSELDFIVADIAYEVWVPAGFVTESSGMNLRELDNAGISLELYPTTFADVILDKGNVVLDNAPAGLTVRSVEYQDNKHVKLNLAYDGTPFDHNIKLEIRIKGAELTDSSRDLVFKDDVPEIILGAGGNWADIVRDEIVSDVDDYEITGSAYIIKTAKGLAWVADQVNNGFNDFSGLTVALASDIDLSAHFWTPIGIHEDSGDECYFKGSFTGQGHEITGVYIGTSNAPDNTWKYVGLFGYIEDASIQGVGLRNCEIYSAKEAGRVGGLAGYVSSCRSPYYIFNCYVTGNITGGSTFASADAYVGGLVGCIYDPNADSAITNCYSTANVTGGDGAYIGGLAGYTDCLQINNSYATGNITGGYSAYVGGLAGAVVYEANNCYAAGNVTGAAGAFVGALVGDNRGTITNGYWNSSAVRTIEGNPENIQGDGFGGLMDTQKTSDEMQTADFALVLNDNQTAMSPSWLTLAEWGRDDAKNDGYPVLVRIGDGKGVSSAGTEKELADGAIAAAKGLLPDNFTAAENIHTNLLDYLNRIEGMSATEVTLTLDASDNANVADDGTITYTQTALTGNVTVKINKEYGTEQAKTIAVTVPAHTATAAEKADGAIAAAKGLLPDNFTAAENIHTNLLDYLNGIAGMSATGVILTLDASGNANVADDGTITYTGTVLTGNVIVKINKENGTEQTKIIAVTVPAHAATAAEEADAAIAAAKWLLPDSFTAAENIHTNLLDYLNGIAGMSATGVILTLDASGNANVADDGTITYTQTALTGNVIVKINKENGTEQTKIIAVTVPAVTISGGGGHSSGRDSSSGNSPQPGSGAEILVNGQAESAGTANTTTQDNQTLTTVVVDQQKLEQRLNQEGSHTLVTIPVSSGADTVIGQLNGQMVKNMENKQAVVEVKTERAVYTLPATQINIDEISSQLGRNVELEDIKVQIEIAEPDAQEVKVVENSAHAGEFSIMVPPVEFNVRCSFGDKTVAVSSFSSYVGRTIAVPEGVDPNKITTGIIVDPDGTVRHVPTKIIQIDGRYYAQINSLTNSTYSVIWHPIEFKDVENHWAKEEINDMGSRMVVSGVGNDMFEPDRDITRAEFAAITVRALGLKPGKGENPFSDVKAADWYAEFIKTAYDYGIISGYDTGEFKPLDKITREQAMTMTARAMDITGLKAELRDTDIKKLLTKYHDSGQSGEWAETSIAACVDQEIVAGKSENLLAPKDDITKAEVAVIIRRLLQKSNLI